MFTENLDFFFDNDWNFSITISCAFSMQTSQINASSPSIRKLTSLSVLPQKEQIKLLEQESIKVSINNLFNFPNVNELVERKTLSIHGLIYEIGSGTLKLLNPLPDKFEII